MTSRSIITIPKPHQPAGDPTYGGNDYEEAPSYTGPLDLGADSLFLGVDRLTLGVA